jgi:hypothetical protein
LRLRQVRSVLSVPGKTTGEAFLILGSRLVLLFFIVVADMIATLYPSRYSAPVSRTSLATSVNAA